MFIRLFDFTIFKSDNILLTARLLIDSSVKISLNQLNLLVL